MSQNNPRKYFRLTKAERKSIEKGLDDKYSSRTMARDLGRAPAAITEEVKRNRCVSKGAGCELSCSGLAAEYSSDLAKPAGLGREPSNSFLTGILA